MSPVAWVFQCLSTVWTTMESRGIWPWTDGGSLTEGLYFLATLGVTTLDTIFNGLRGGLKHTLKHREEMKSALGLG